MSTVELVLKEGPVRIPSLAGAGRDKTVSLWGDISVSESFPPNVHEALYVLSLRKRVNRPEEVAEAERDLATAIRLLAPAWPFSGGSFMVLDSHEVLTSPRFESNAERVRAELLAATGQRIVSSSLSMPYETLATYDRPPLETASAIATAAKGHAGLRRLLAYHQAAWVGYHISARTDRASWFIDLYKVRDLLGKLYGSNETVKSRRTCLPGRGVRR